MFHRESVLEIISDMSKDAYGFRMRKDWDSFSDEELEAEVNYMQALIRDGIEEDRQREARAVIAWEAHISKMMSDFNISRADALRWDFQAMDVDGDAEFYCYKHQLPYSLENKILEDMR